MFLNTYITVEMTFFCDYNYDKIIQRAKDRLGKEIQQETLDTQHEKLRFENSQ